MSKKSHHFLTLWPWPLTYDLENLIRSGHYHYQWVYQIWEQSIPWFLSYRVNTIAGGGRLRRKTITSPDPSDTGDIIKCVKSRVQFQKGLDLWAHYQLLVIRFCISNLKKYDHNFAHGLLARLLFYKQSKVRPISIIRTRITQKFKFVRFGLWANKYLWKGSLVCPVQVLFNTTHLWKLFLLEI